MNDTPHGRGLVYLHTKPRRKAQSFSSPPIQSAPAKLPCYPIAPEPDNRPRLPAFDVRPHKMVRIVRSALRRGELRIEPAFWLAGRAVYDKDLVRKAIERFKRDFLERGGKVTHAPRP